jgi:hypothetical protein
MQPNYRWIRPNYRQMRPNFGFLEDYCFFHMSNTIRPNFSKFHWIFQKSTESATSEFFDPHEFSNTTCPNIASSARSHTATEDASHTGPLGQRLNPKRTKKMRAVPSPRRTPPATAGGTTPARAESISFIHRGAIENGPSQSLLPSISDASLLPPPLPLPASACSSSPERFSHPPSDSKERIDFNLSLSCWNWLFYR